MAQKPLTTIRIARKNLRGKSGRTIALVIIVAIMAFALFGGAVLTQGLNGGMRSLEARLGADIAVVPPGSEADYESQLLVGAPVSIYFDGSVIQQIATIAGVEQVTPQFFLATYPDSECCTTLVQIVGIDYDTDFVVSPWLSQFLQHQLGDGEIIVGSRVGVHNNAVVFFGSVFEVTARLERTATGMDTTVFMNMNTARELAIIAQAGGFVSYDVDIKNAISTALVSVSHGYDVDEVVNNIRRNIPYVGIVTSDGIYSNVSTSLRFFTGIIRVITIAFGVLAVLILAALFSLIANSRKKEFAVLRTIGATRKKLGNIVLTEAFIISLRGAIIGSGLAASIVLPFGRIIGIQMGMPLLVPNLMNTLLLLAFSLTISIVVAPLSAAYSAFKISHAETYATMREGE